MVNRELLPWIGAGVLGAHNLEEALTAPAWLVAHSADLQMRFGILMPQLSKAGLLLALALVTIASIAWIAAARHSSPQSLGAYSLIVLFGMYFANAVFPHIVGALILSQYVPGVLTASFAVVPFTFLFLICEIRSNRYAVGGAFTALAVAIILYICIGIVTRTLVAL
jgi:hypothetical protein